MRNKAREIALIQEIVPHYRVAVFSRLARRLDGRLTIYSTRFEQDVVGARCVRCTGFGLARVRLLVEPFADVAQGKCAAVICEGRLGLLTCVLVALAGRYLGSRTIWWTPLWRPNGRVEIGGGIRGWLMRTILRRADSVLVYGSKARMVAAGAGLVSERIKVAYNSLDTPGLLEAERPWREDPSALRRFAVARGLVDKRIVLYVGQFIHRKRVPDLVRAFAQVHNEPGRGGMALVLIGDGPAMAETRAVVEANGLGDDVHFEGAISSIAQITPYFLLARVLVLPGAGGLAVNQAMTHGVPVIVGGGDGTESDAVLPGENGYYWDGESVDGLATLIRRVVELPTDAWDAMSASARSVVRDKVNADRMVQGIIDSLGPIAATP